MAPAPAVVAADETTVGAKSRVRRIVMAGAGARLYVRGRASESFRPGLGQPRAWPPTQRRTSSSPTIPSASWSPTVQTIL